MTKLTDYKDLTKYKEMSMNDLSSEINEFGEKEEFYQKRENYRMFEYCQEMRIALETIWRKRYANGEDYHLCKFGEKCNHE